MMNKSLPPPNLQIDFPDGSAKGFFLSPLGFKTSGKPHAVGAALANLGNTCFLNAILQCVTHTVPLAQKLLSADHSSCSGDDGEFCSFCALKKHVEFCLLMSGRTVSPKDFAYNLNKLSADFQLGSQEDAHEFLRCLLDSVHSCCLGPKSKNRLSSLEEDSIVKEVFGGRLRSQLRYVECGHTSDTYEPFLDLSLEIDHVNSLVEALESFTKVERIEDPDLMFTCKDCSTQVSVEKQFKLEHAPQVIAFHLKRFNANGLFIGKIHKFVQYPLELDLRPFLNSSEEEQVKYELYAVVEHLGSFFGGHYVCAIRSSPSMWHCMDDDEVTEVSETRVLDCQAYILFYVKQGTAPWFSSLMEVQKIAVADIFHDTSPVSVLNHMDSDAVSPSVEETTSSSSGERLETDYGCSLPSDACSKLLKPDTEKFHPLTPPRSPDNICNDDVADEAARKTSMTQPFRIPSSRDCSIHMFHEEPLETEEEDDVHFSFVQERLKGNKEVGKPSCESGKGEHLNYAARRLVRGMPSSRRLGILACFDEQHRSHSKKQSLTQKIQPPAKRKLDSNLLGRPDRSRMTMPKPGKSLSSHSIRRGLFDEIEAASPRTK